jgi:putative component of membrane protein insertase Oxa1/YidC/SpoIIIJ protein YidD
MPRKSATALLGKSFALPLWVAAQVGKMNRGHIAISNRFLLVAFLWFQAFFSQGAILSAQAPVLEPDAWEPDAIGKEFPPKSVEKSELAMDAWLAKALIRFYQTDIGPNSISRCPFFISCSNFAMQAIEKYGFFPGILLFIDRIYYRENPAAYLFYPKKRNSRLFLKLDDTYFLKGELADEYFQWSQ